MLFVLFFIYSHYLCHSGVLCYFYYSCYPRYFGYSYNSQIDKKYAVRMILLIHVP